MFYFSSQSVQAAPRNVFFGQLIGLLAGVFALLAASRSLDFGTLLDTCGDGLATRAPRPGRCYHFDRGRCIDDSSTLTGDFAACRLGDDRAGDIDKSGPWGAFPALGPARGRLSLKTGFNQRNGAHFGGGFGPKTWSKRLTVEENGV
ncbi:MAG: hypothetical protein CK552_01295 [Actinobacteria bacterium]|nr:MAG: hypothetical protein CK552_01295 [Actinomycetota bacterium]